MTVSAMLSLVTPIGSKAMNGMSFGSLLIVNPPLRLVRSSPFSRATTASALMREDLFKENTYSQDFLHLNEVGYEALNRELVRILTTLER
jgi:hypothetical protein